MGFLNQSKVQIYLIFPVSLSCVFIHYMMLHAQWVGHRVFFCNIEDSGRRLEPDRTKSVILRLSCEAKLYQDAGIGKSVA